MMVSQSQKVFTSPTKQQTIDILEQIRNGTHPNQQSKLFKQQGEKTNWEIKSSDPKEHVASTHFERKSDLLEQRAQRDRKQQRFFDLSYKKNMISHQKKNFALGFQFAVKNEMETNETYRTTNGQSRHLSGDRIITRPGTALCEAGSVNTSATWANSSAKQNHDSTIRRRKEDFKPNQEIVTIEYAGKVQPSLNPFSSFSLSQSLNNAPFSQSLKTFLPVKERPSIAVS